jgi:hypothetical protein
MITCALNRVWLLLQRVYSEIRFPVVRSNPRLRPAIPIRATESSMQSEGGEIKVVASLQSRRVVFARVFLPILAEAAVGGFLMRVGAEFVDIDVDAEPGSGRQIDPAVLHVQ